MKRLVLVCLLIAAPAAADEPVPAWPKGAQKYADWISTAGVAGEIAGATIESWRAPDRGHALRCEAARLGVGVLLSEALKHLIPRWRPDHSDRLSFPSEHTAISFAAARSWSLHFSVPLGGSVGYERMAANKHHGSDVAAGAGLGLLTWLVCH